MTIETTPIEAPDHATETGDERVLDWRTEILHGTVAGAAGLTALCVALLSGMPETAAYVITGLVSLWLVIVGADRAVKHRRPGR